MVRVISAHHFDSQIVQTCEDPLAVSVAPPDRLLIALPHHIIEVRDLSAEGKTILTFPTVDSVSFLNYCSAVKNHIMDFMKKMYHRNLVLLRYYCECKAEPIKIVKHQRNTADHPPKKISKHASELLEHYSKSPFFQNNLNYINWKFLKRKVYTPSVMILADELVAKNIVTTIKSDLIKSPEPVFEANPGLGLITQELLKIDKLDLPKLCVFESDPYFRQKLLELCDQYSGRLKMFNTNILELWKINFLDKIDKGNRLKGLMDDVSVKEWEQAPCVKIIGALPTSCFIRSVIISIIFRYGLITYGRPELYVLISPSLYASICKPNRGTETLFNILFKWQCLMEVDHQALLPWTLEKPRIIKKLTNSGIDPTKFYLLKAVPKQDLYKIVSPELMKPLWYFCKTVIRGKKHRILPSLEKWIPGCGPRLISKGIDTFTEFGDLTTDEVLQVFLEFVNWPEFSSCLFMTSMEDHLMKFETEDISDSVGDDSSDFSREQILNEVTDRSQVD